MLHAVRLLCDGAMAAVLVVLMMGQGRRTGEVTALPLCV